MIALPSALHDDYRSDAEATLDALCVAYPNVALTNVWIFEQEGDHSLGRCGNASRIELNAFWFSKPRSVLDEAVARGRAVEPPDAMPWHGRIGGVENEFARLLIHEFSHLLMRATPGADRWARRMAARAIDNPSLAVSGYALSDDDDSGAEWWAETFAALRLGGAGSPQVGEMAAFLAARLDAAKAEKSVVDYTPNASVPTERCALCSHFEAPDGCARVLGEIAPEGWCKLFRRR